MALPRHSMRAPQPVHSTKRPPHAAPPLSSSSSANSSSIVCSERSRHCRPHPHAGFPEYLAGPDHGPPAALPSFTPARSGARRQAPSPMALLKRVRDVFWKSRKKSKDTPAATPAEFPPRPVSSCDHPPERDMPYGSYAPPCDGSEKEVSMRQDGQRSARAMKSSFRWEGEDLRNAQHSGKAKERVSFRLPGHRQAGRVQSSHARLPTLREQRRTPTPEQPAYLHHQLDRSVADDPEPEHSFPPRPCRVSGGGLFASSSDDSISPNSTPAVGTVTDKGGPKSNYQPPSVEEVEDAEYGSIPSDHEQSSKQRRPQQLLQREQRRRQRQTKEPQQTRLPQPRQLPKQDVKPQQKQQSRLQPKPLPKQQQAKSPSSRLSMTPGPPTPKAQERAETFVSMDSAEWMVGKQGKQPKQELPYRRTRIDPPVPKRHPARSNRTHSVDSKIEPPSTCGYPVPFDDQAIVIVTDDDSRMLDSEEMSRIMDSVQQMYASQHNLPSKEKELFAQRIAELERQKREREMQFFELEKQNNEMTRRNSELEKHITNFSSRYSNQRQQLTELRLREEERMMYAAQSDRPPNGVLTPPRSSSCVSALDRPDWVTAWAEQQAEPYVHREDTRRPPGAKLVDELQMSQHHSKPSSLKSAPACRQASPAPASPALGPGTAARYHRLNSSSHVQRSPLVPTSLFDSTPELLEPSCGQQPKLFGSGAKVVHNELNQRQPHGVSFYQHIEQQQAPQRTDQPKQGDLRQQQRPPPVVMQQPQRCGSAASFQPQPSRYKKQPAPARSSSVDIQPLSIRKSSLSQKSYASLPQSTPPVSQHPYYHSPTRMDYTPQRTHSREVQTYQRPHPLLAANPGAVAVASPWERVTPEQHHSLSNNSPRPTLTTTTSLGSGNHHVYADDIHLGPIDFYTRQQEKARSNALLYQHLHQQPHQQQMASTTLTPLPPQPPPPPMSPVRHNGHSRSNSYTGNGGYTYNGAIVPVGANTPTHASLLQASANRRLERNEARNREEAVRRAEANRPDPALEAARMGKAVDMVTPGFEGERAKRIATQQREQRQRIAAASMRGGSVGR